MSVVTKVFLSNTTQAVRLPRAVAFDDSVTEVEIDVIGEARLIRPVGSAIDVFWESGVRIGDDFAREQPEVGQERAWA